MKRRAPGTGTVEEHQGVLRLRMPESIDPKRTWLKRTFPLTCEKAAHGYMDAVAQQARTFVDKRDVKFNLALIWPRFVARQSNDVERRRGMHAAHKRRSHLEGLGSRWLAGSPFWNKEMSLVRGQEITDWLDEVRTTARSKRGGFISDSWVHQLAREIRAAFEHVGMSPPVFETKAGKRQKGSVSALTLRQQKQFFRVLDDEADKIMAGCQMGAGLRKGEVLSLRATNVILGPDPHIMVETGGDHAAPTKSLKPRRVELFDPGLGFFRRAMRRYRDNPRGLLFVGPKGGYLKHWPDKFVQWSEALGMRVTSHMMRHTYAYSMLSGSWGYEPMGVTFVSRQFGHADTKTTEEFYGHWDPGAGLTTARLLRGETQRNGQVITAEWLLGEAQAHSREASLASPRSSLSSSNWVSDGSSSNCGGVLADLDAGAYRMAAQAALTFARAIRAGEPAVDEAKYFLKSLGEDREAMRILLLLLEGDPRAVTQAALLAGRFARESQSTTREEGVA